MYNYDPTDESEEVVNKIRQISTASSTVSGRELNFSSDFLY